MKLLINPRISTATKNKPENYGMLRRFQRIVVEAYWRGVVLREKGYTLPTIKSFTVPEAGKFC